MYVTLLLIFFSFNAYVRQIVISNQLFDVAISNGCLEFLSWGLYKRLISLETQVGITSQRNKWVNTDHRKSQRWDQVPWRSTHLLLASHTRRKSYFKLKNKIRVFRPGKWNNMRQVKENIRSQNQCPDQLNETIPIRNQAYTDPWKHQRWGQVLRRSNHPVSTCHTCHEPSFMIMNADLSAVKVNVPSAV
jgi:hypothetical protein